MCYALSPFRLICQLLAWFGTLGTWWDWQVIFSLYIYFNVLRDFIVFSLLLGESASPLCCPILGVLHHTAGAQ